MNEILDRFTGNISPIALLVSVFLWSWVDIVPFSPALFMAAGVPVDVTPFITSFIVSAMVLALFAASKKIRLRILSSKVYALSCLLCGSVGSLCIWFGILNASFVLLIIGGVLIGIFQSVGALVSGSIATSQGPTNALIHLAAALPFNIIAVLLVMFLKPVASVVLTVALPLFSALCYAIFLIRGQNKSTLMTVTVIKDRVQTGVRRTKKIFGCDPYFLLMVLFICISFGFANYQAIFAASTHGSYFDYTAVIIRAVTSLVILLGYLFLSWRPYAMLRIVLVLMALGLIASGTISVLGNFGTFLFDALILTGYAGFDLLIWALIIMLSYRSGASILKIICVVYTIDQLGILLGTSLGLFAGSQNAIIVSYIALGSILLLLILGFSSGKNAIKDNLSTYEIDFNKPEDAEAPEADSLRTSQGYAENLAEISARFFLTSRESEVLGLLVAGRNGPYISENLHVSENTVKTHIQHIYTKMDVHDRQELLDIVLAHQS